MVYAAAVRQSNQAPFRSEPDRRSPEIARLRWCRPLIYLLNREFELDQIECQELCFREHTVVSAVAGDKFAVCFSCQ